MKATVEMCQMIKAENTKLKNHIEMQDLTIQKLYAQLNNPQTTIASNGYFQADIPKYTLTYCNTADEENTKLKQDKKDLIEKLKQEIEDNADYYDEEDTGTIVIPTLLKILERLGE